MSQMNICVMCHTCHLTSKHTRFLQIDGTCKGGLNKYFNTKNKDMLYISFQPII